MILQKPAHEFLDLHARILQNVMPRIGETMHDGFGEETRPLI